VTRLDRTGEAIDEEPHVCDRGWVDRNAEHPVPCLECKPHLAPEQRRRRIHGVDPGPTSATCLPARADEEREGSEKR
jgi:hypothetical protein